jgi:uncharacterized protein
MIRDMPGRPRTNRLARERSLYLRQHAGNPVDWFPWSEEAFAEAVRLERPVFLSIGYSSCHWCHVMERESFESDEVAALLNADFVSIKVDREERPDLDHYYMAVCQALTGSGGWPLTVFLTPEKKPFFAGTYYPKTGRYGRMGFLELLPRLAGIWKTRKGDVLASAAEIARVPGRVRAEPIEGASATLDPALREEAFRSLSEDFDPEHGGFGSAPKFPIPHHLLFLLRHWRRTGEGAALDMVERTLAAMRRGGIFDQLGLGFHRYSTDAGWIVPHFEKMLYDQALLAMAYTEAHQATGRAADRSVAEEIFAYVLRDLAVADGAFAASEDADAAGEEGSFYLWTAEAVKRVLPPEDAELAIRAFRIGRSEPTVLTLAGDFVESDLRLAEVREKMRLAREKRPKPARDPKVLADWNGLMIAALAKAARAFGRDDYLAAAGRAADRLLSLLVSSDGTFLRCLDGGEARIPAFLDDHAFLAWGLLELYEAGFVPRNLEAAAALVRRAVELFWDEEAGGFFFAPDSPAPELPLRTKESYDGAIPSGNAVMMLVLLRLARMTGNPELEARAARTGGAFAGSIARSPSAHTFWMMALDLAGGPGVEVVVVGRRGAEDTEALLGVIRSSYLPNAVTLFKPADDPRDTERLSAIAPFVFGMEMVEGAAAAYVCSDFVCRAPVTGPDDLRGLLVTRSRTS